MGPDTDTIAAIATAPGRGGIGIVRISGRDLRALGEALSGKQLIPRHATHCEFSDHQGAAIDQGIVLYFPAPNSFTGEDVLELQGHGGLVVMDNLLAQVLMRGVRMARPGEFSERAFLNNKLDLVQAEAIADLIDAGSKQTVMAALRTLRGEFSARIRCFLEELIQLRVYVEAAIDFPEEEIDFLGDSKVGDELSGLIEQLQGILRSATQGTLLQEGMRVVIAGKPNAGKSSLLNALAGEDRAIVTAIPGTTRDVLRERVHIDGMPLHVIDTAGLRESPDPVEQEGIRRAWVEIEQADRVLFVIDSNDDYSLDPMVNWPSFAQRFPGRRELTFVFNKIDLVKQTASLIAGDYPVIALSAKTGDGLELLRQHLKDCMGFRSGEDSLFVARRRHLDALRRAQEHIARAAVAAAESAGELVAEDLRQAQQALGEITGEFGADDLLEAIFSSFCVGK
ncbi:MAG: tRNA uridine-5-carboxymethylaminomethyl(34) synthesis GTPase MnmE [Porticoccaceae bacterium]